MTKRIHKSFCTGLLFCLGLGLAYGQAQSKKETDALRAGRLQQEFKKELTAGLLELWYPRAIDEERGGFYSTFTREWKLAENQQKMIVTQARHVWTNAKAAELFPENPVYRKAAAHGLQFLKDKMWDQEYGGFYNLVTREGEPVSGSGYDQYKRTYGNAFAIYALAAYYALSKDQEALDLAQKAFTWLDEHAYDPEYGGYFTSLTRQGEVVMEDPQKDIYENINLFYKEQNTSIHLLEAFTELYHVWPDAQVESRLKELLQTVRDKITTKPGYLQLYFYRDWTPVSLRDSSAAVREAHYSVDHVSFGHDIETAFLMLEASAALDRFEWDKTMETAKMMVDHTVANGFDPKRSGIYERGYYFKDQPTITIVDERKNWWSQAEGLNALLLFSKLYPSELVYEQQFIKQWDYIKKYMIDQQYGGWYSFGLDTEPEAKHGTKGNIWKGAYHDGRALMNIVRMLEGEDILSKH